MEERVREILFKTRRHAIGSYSAYPPALQQPNEGGGGSLLSYLSPRVIVQLKERWTEYKNPRKLQKFVSLFVSPNADHVAVAFRNQITFLHKDNDYQEPTGTFNSGSNNTFVYGTWSEAHDVLGVVDDSDNIYFIKANGEELTRITKKHLKMSLPILGLILQDESDAKKSCLCTFSILTSDGLLHDVEIGQDPSACVFSANALHSGAFLKKQVLCLDYYPTCSLFATVSTAGNVPSSKTAEHPGLVSLSLWRRSTCSVLELLISTEFEGLYSVAKDHMGWLTHPKVLISPKGKFIATLDVRGCLFIFKFHEEQCSLLISCAEGIQNSKTEIDTSFGGREFLTDIMDFAWWSDNILAIVQRDGTFAVFDVCTGVKLSENDPSYMMPLLARASELVGSLFLLESKPSSYDYESSDRRGGSNLYLAEQLDGTILWNLVSFSETSVPEMYDILIRNEEYQSALSFADRHGLDKDNVLKSQWLSSGKGVNEINKLLSAIKDQAFVLSECINNIGPTEDAVRVSLTYGLQLTDHYKFCVTEDDECIQAWDFCIARLKLLQFRDRLETFLGINMGRFSVQDYNKFRSSPIKEAAVVLAEKGKIGALNLLFKRHPYSLTPFLLDILAAIPETVPVQTYAQLLPGNSLPAITALREEDWVECDKMISFIKRLPNDYSSCNLIRTEPIVKKCTGFQWPSTSDLSLWYKNRAREIDSLSGQLENSMCLVDVACRKGISELQQFLEDISYLDQLIYSDDHIDNLNFSMSLSVWEQLPDYEKFKLMLMGVKEENVIERLQKKAIPFMKRKSCVRTTQSEDSLMGRNSSTEKIADSFLVRWLKEISLENKLEICLIVIGGGFTGPGNNCFFTDDIEVVDSALQCIYLSSDTDRWTTMASILSKLPLLRSSEYEGLKSRLKLAEGHIEAGRLLSLYQVPKPISFFLEAHLDEKGVKQLLRLILSKFIRRQLGRSDNDWANLWHDLLSLQEKAFPFLDLEYILIEFCRGLLKAGKFSLARNYLKGTGSVGLAADKAENLVLQAAREYFFSASSLDSQEIWKAKECLNILPGNRNVRAEIDMINAVTVKLPNLGASILPMQFRQMKDPMDIIKMAITSQAGAYLNVDELIEVAKLLGLNSQDDISAVQEAIAREAAVAGDLQLAFDLCFLLAKKGHGSVWDLCAALARGPALENMDFSSRKHLLGFALSHCDEESIGELLHAWKDLDMQGQCESLMMLTGREPDEVHSSSNISNVSYSTLGTVDIWSEKVDNIGFDDQELQFNKIKEMLSLIAKNLSAENVHQWDSLRDNGKILSFAALDLPWLLELSSNEEIGVKRISSSISLKKCVSIRAQAILTILSWLALNGFAPKDDLIASLAKSIMEPPVTEEEDILGCAFLLNLVDAFHGVDVIEGFVKMRDNYNEINSIMNVGMIYGLLHNRGVECLDPGQRRMLLSKEFEHKQRSLASDERDQLDKAQSTFWREWKMKLEEQKRVADQSRILEQIVPGVETARFLSGDMDYIESVVFSLIESLKLEKKHILKDVSELVQTYGLDKTKVLLHYISSILVSKSWTVEDIVVDVSELKKELLASAPETIKVIASSIYPMIDGHDKQRLACIYSLLSECYLQLEEQEEPQPIIDSDPHHANIMNLAHFSKIVGQECYRVSFIGGLNFKNVAGLQDLNWDNFSTEICSHIDESNVEALANMVHNLLGIYGDSVPVGILSWQDVYRHHAFRLMKVLESRSKTESDFQSSQDLYSFVVKLEQTYDACRKYVKFMEYPHVLDLMKLFFTVILAIEKPLRSVSFDLIWQECLIMLLHLWLRLVYDFRELKFRQNSDEMFSESLITCLKDFENLIIEGKVSLSEGWGTVVSFISYGLDGGVVHEVFNFCRAMLFSGCRFVSIAEVYMDAMGQLPPGSAMVSNMKEFSVNIQDLSHLYLSILETIMPNLAIGSLQQQNLHTLLSSLSKLEGDLEELKRVRHAVWERIAEFSGNLELPSHIRVYILELMQFIVATGKKGKGFSSEIEASLLPWEGCEDLQNTAVNHEKTTAAQISSIADTSNRFKNTLVALKSSQLLSIISPGMEITAEDLLTVESAVSCFLKVSNSATSEAHVDALMAMLGEWEGLFVVGKTDSPKLSDDGNGWGNDDWDEGWESFQEEPKEKEVKENSSLSIHPLHVCWMEIFKRLFMLSGHMELLKLIDQYNGQPMQALVDEDGAHCLSQIALDIDCILALKLMLLFPFEAPQLQCLDAVEDMLKQRGIPEELGHDHELLVLVLSSGIIMKIINRSSYSSIFSYLCYLVGNIARWCQEAKLLSHKSMMVNEDQPNKKLSILFTRLLFPCYISELVKADQLILAGFLVTKFLHTNASLSLINVTDAILRSYLHNQLQMLQDGESSGEGLTSELNTSISSLRGKMANLVQSALQLLPSDGR